MENELKQLTYNIFKNFNFTYDQKKLIFDYVIKIINKNNNSKTDDIIIDTAIEVGYEKYYDDGYYNWIKDLWDKIIAEVSDYRDYITNNNVIFRNEEYGLPTITFEFIKNIPDTCFIKLSDGRIYIATLNHGSQIYINKVFKITDNTDSVGAYIIDIDTDDIPVTGSGSNAESIFGTYGQLRAALDAGKTIVFFEKANQVITIVTNIYYNSGYIAIRYIDKYKIYCEIKIDIDGYSLSGFSKKQLMQLSISNTVTNSSTIAPLSANQGKVLNTKITNLENKISTVYKAKGSKASFADVLALTDAKVGDVWDIGTKFIFNNETYPAGTNVVCIQDTSETSHDYTHWDSLGGMINGLLANYHIAHDLLSTNSTMVLDANQGRILNEKITEINKKINTFLLPNYTQWSTINNTNIETILGTAKNLNDAIIYGNDFTCNNEKVKVSISEDPTDGFVIVDFECNEYNQGYLVKTHKLRVNYGINNDNNYVYLAGYAIYSYIQHVPNILLEHTLSNNPPTTDEEITSIVNTILGSREYRDLISIGNVTVNIKLTSNTPCAIYFDYNNYSICRAFFYNKGMYYAVLNSGSTLSVNTIKNVLE